MNYQDYFDRDIVIPAPSFLAVIHYKRETKELFLVLRRNGHRYKYSSVPVKVFTELAESTNKGSFVSLNIISGNPYPCVKLDPMPMATLERFTMPAGTKYWLSR